MTTTDVSRLLAPRSVAVIGASDRSGNLGGVAVGLLRKFGFPGPIWPVHPTADSVRGLKPYPRVADTPGIADVAILAVPAAACADLVRECAAAGITHGVIWAGGFAEAGRQGASLQRTLAAACEESQFKVVGPNCLGIIDTRLPLTLTFASFLREIDEMVSGDISMISQSGGLATQIQAMAGRAGFGFRYMISSGNEVSLDLSDFLHALARDPATKVVCAYVEGVRNGPGFLAALEATREAGKPVVVLKAGSTQASAEAAAAHTGALVGEGRVWSSIMDEFGVIEVRSVMELLDVALELSSMDLAKLPGGAGLAAVTFGGGMGVLAADQAARHGLSMPPLSEETKDRLRPLVPPVAAIGNPVDITPQSYLDPSWLPHLPTALDVIAADPAVHSVLIQAGPMATGGADVARVVGEFRERTDKAVSLSWPLAPPDAMGPLRAARLHVFEEGDDAIAVLGNLVRNRERSSRLRSAAPRPLHFDWPSHVPIAAEGLVIPEHECHGILADAGLPVADGRLAKSEDEASAAARAISFPVVMKGISPSVTHRAVAGLLALNIGDDAATRREYRRLVSKAHEAGVELVGVYVQHMVPNGAEILVSALTDPLFGVVVSVGAGGTATEALDDVTLRRAPVGPDDAMDMLDALSGPYTVLPEPGTLERSQLASFVSLFSRLAASAPWTGFVFEANPVKVGPDGPVAVDGLLIITEP